MAKHAVGKRGKVVQVLLNAAAECDVGLHRERWVQQRQLNSGNKTQTQRARLGIGRQGVGLHKAGFDQSRKRKQGPNERGSGR
jgi:hypothetical protein